MLRRLFRFIGRVLRALWRGVDLLRRTALNLVLLVLIVAALVAFFRAVPEVPQGAALVLRPQGVLVEQTVEAPLALLRGGAAGGQVALHDLLEAIRAAADDERIGALVIETDDLAGAGLSKLGELREAVVAFKASGKPVLARGERFTQGQYYLATVADEVHLAPDGFLLLQGLARHLTYFKDALDSLGIKLHVFRVGEYKSFSEPFTRNDMSDEDREASRDLLDGLWGAMRGEVARARKLTPEALDRYVLGFADVLAQAGGDPARAAQAAGLVDRLSTRDEWRAHLIERVGADKAGTGYRSVEADAYLFSLRAARPRHRDRVAVLVAQGAIADGEQPASAVGGDTLARQIREAREDNAVKAVVLRIDSPGGSAFASEVIRRELELTRRAGKPVVASMSSVAASGGYWIAVGADEIWALPTTVTGSIGIFAMLPEVSGPLARLGVHVDGVATGPLAGMPDPRRALDPGMAKAMQLGIEHGYRRFLEVVAEGRRMKVGEVDAVARGRVWTGETALELGLVDQLGGVDAAVRAAAKRAGLEHYSVQWPVTEVSAGRVLLQRLLADVGLDAALAAPASLRLVDGLEAAAAELARWNDPQQRYAHCLCAAPE
ncbi:putative protease IV [Azoarcus olearius]|uniref:signal peptide peptidase SppA n=1 Tax=Azoarcus sp. (strain BH72) TaxID=418699 RepID=UPI00059F1203|nr:signal peptide peptidase SppA [Azoarcus olearius]ANQ87126.1 putative protease IV [Azoarcus olearius]